MVRTFPLLFLLLVAAQPGFGHRALALEDPCGTGIRMPLARRLMRGESCWTQQGDLCIPRELWQRWLGDRLAPRWCEGESVVLRARSAPENSLAESHPKEARLVPEARSLPAPCRPSPLARAIHGIEVLRERLSQGLAPVDPSGLFRSILLGEAGGKDSPAPMLRELGLVHLLSASGLHLYAIARVWSAILCSVSEALEIPIWIALPMARALVGASWFAAWCLAGAPPGMLRPWAVLAARRIARIAGFRWRVWVPIALALALSFPGQPGSGWRGRVFFALALGGGLAAISSEPSEATSPLGRAWCLALGSWSLAAIWSAWETGLLALATPLLSLATIPLWCLILYPALELWALGRWLGISGPSPPSLMGQGLLVASRGVEAICALCMKEGMDLFVISRGALCLGLALSGAVLAIPEGAWRPGRWVVPGALALGIRFASGWMGKAPAAFSSNRPEPASQVEQLDVGQGDAALVIQSPWQSAWQPAWLAKAGNVPDRAGLLDTGSEQALGDTDWLRLLAARGIRALAWVGLTHLDEDHSGGLRRLARLLPIRCLSLSAGELESERGDEYARELARAGVIATVWSSSCIPFPFFSPAPERSGATRNGNMGALLVPLSRDAFYLAAGDADAAEEGPIGRWAILEASRRSPRAEFILKISHHGSKTSSSLPFLKRLHPTAAVISVGLGNRYGHPSPETLKKLEALHVPIFRTDRDGGLNVERILRKFHQNLK